MSSLPDYSTFPERFAALADQYPWIKAQREEICRRADYWAATDDAVLWDSIPSQAVPRSLFVSRDHGCPTCGPVINQGYGYYPWKMDPVGHPWKVQCPKCAQWFPKNDFSAYYRSGLDEAGRFDSQKADAKLLVNAEHPDANDPLHRFGVDPGPGYVDPEGRLYAFVGCYNMHAFWGRVPYPQARYGITTGCLDLAYAALLTGNRVYARKAAVILARIATLYPAMDCRAWHKKGPYTYANVWVTGKVLDMIWDNFLVDKLLRSYALVVDAVRDDPELTAFLKGKEACFPERRAFADPSAFVQLLENAYLQEVFDNAQTGRLAGNTGMTEECITLLALVTRDPALRQAATAWLFAPRRITDYETESHRRHGGGLSELIFNLTGDGFSWESGGYCEILPQALVSIHKILSCYNWVEKNAVFDTTLALLRQRLAAYYRNQYALVCLTRFKPYWGDCGAFCQPYLQTGLDPAPFLDGFLTFGDPEMGRVARSILDNPEQRQACSLQLDDLFFVPADIEQRLKQFEALRPEPQPPSVNLTARGLVLLKQGTEPAARCLWTHYGNNKDCHNHRDTLGLGMFAFGRDILPELGYPDLADRNSHLNWHHSMISNNTVVVDRQDNLRYIDIADQTLFAESPLCAVTAIDARAVYPDLARYGRLFALVNVSDTDFYVVDFFEVQGGAEHVYSFHSGDGELFPDPGVAFTRQETGTYAGADIAYGAEVDYPCKKYRWGYGNGRQFLYDVARSAPTDGAGFVWNLRNTRNASPFGDRVRCRLNLLTPAAEIALAKGKPPQNTAGNPESIHYILAKTTGDAASHVTDFCAVIEAYLDGARPIREVRKLGKLAGGDFAAALMVTLSNGDRDIVVKLGSADETATFEEGLSVQGRFAVLRLDRDNNVKAYFASQTRQIKYGDRFQVSLCPSATSRVRDFDPGASEHGTIVLEDVITIPPDVRRPLWTDIHPTQVLADGNYRVCAVRTEDGRTVLDVGPVSFIVAPKYTNVFENTPLANAFEHAFAKGAVVQIPFSYYGKMR
ncbi:MAG: hypothetical protein A3K19_09120 [Lentisphaerae bacterium RIFOXYB12_FULL_65_16]|nr:MAG: hypothetical protein A3K18_14760 [Lentisphaerae bacterium RIFOXYA12_64_32]OGV90346.1 MAG: hypothetical protein A3K19_09120 [Lentisphaerae bacterium RIFOXYB12_FULL_65_16]